jgi:hypothetical protein
VRISTNRGVVARFQQRVAQLFHRFAIQRIQHLRAIEGDPGDAVFFLEQDVFVSHVVVAIS